jgi:hypothetical protein
MIAPRKNARFKVREITVTQHGATYQTFELYGWLNGKMVRRRFKSRAEALGQKNLLEVEAASEPCEMTVRQTRLSSAQLAEAETAFARLGGRPLSLAVDWFLDTYRPPVTEKALAEAKAAFIADRERHVRPMTLRDYKLTLHDFAAAIGERNVHEVETAAVLEFLTGRNVGKKRWNNLRGDLHAFFEFCKGPPRQWVRENPVASVPKFTIARDVPAILTVTQAAELMRHVEEFEGGGLVPYFALALFAGLRPSIVEGEIWKLSRLKDPAQAIDLNLNVIRLGCEITKTNSVRQVKIRPNLAAWLTSYPLADYPLWVPGMKPLVTQVRKKFELSDDVLRHTWISMHVAAFKSLGEAALEAGNSETIIRRHYLNLVSEADAAAFWAIKPAGA